MLDSLPQGEEAAQRLTVPRLRLRRDWHKGLDPDHVDHRCGVFTAHTCAPRAAVDAAHAAPC